MPNRTRFFTSQNRCTSCGGSVWRFRVVVSCGGFMWRFRVAVPCGGFVWWFRVAVPCGGFVWRFRVVASCAATRVYYSTITRHAKALRCIFYFIFCAQCDHGPLHGHFFSAQRRCEIAIHMRRSRPPCRVQWCTHSDQCDCFLEYRTWFLYIDGCACCKKRWMDEGFCWLRSWSVLCPTHAIIIYCMMIEKSGRNSEFLVKGISRWWRVLFEIWKYFKAVFFNFSKMENWQKIINIPHVVKSQERFDRIISTSEFLVNAKTICGQKAALYYTLWQAQWKLGFHSCWMTLETPLTGLVTYWTRFDHTGWRGEISSTTLLAGVWTVHWGHGQNVNSKLKTLHRFPGVWSEKWAELARKPL